MPPCLPPYLALPLTRLATVDVPCRQSQEHLRFEPRLIALVDAKAIIASAVQLFFILSSLARVCIRGVSKRANLCDTRYFGVIASFVGLRFRQGGAILLRGYETVSATATRPSFVSTRRAPRHFFTPATFGFIRSVSITSCAFVLAWTIRP